MSDYVPRENTGTLHKNDKGDNPARPDYRGSANIGGVVYDLAGWVKEGKNGKFLSLAVNEPREKPAAAEQDSGQAEDNLPF